MEGELERRGGGLICELSHREKVINTFSQVHRPPEILLMLVPQKSMGGSAQGSRPVSVQLHAKYSTDYPDTAPSLHLQEPQGLTSDQVKDLEKELVQLAKSKEGEVSE